MMINRTKYRAWLISIVLAAVAFGIFYYMYMGKQEKTFPEGTLVWQVEDVQEHTAA